MKADQQRTKVGGTRTAEGWIPHHRHVCGQLLPVRVKWTGTATLPTPERDSLGRLVYALPGGGDYVPPDAKDYEREMKTP